VSLVLLPLDALVVASRANERLESTAASESASPGLPPYPLLAPVKNGSQTVGLSGSVGLVF
jgi:hypothetical protein